MRSRPRSSPSSSCCGCWCQGFLAFLLKFLNFFQTFVGISIIVYSVWMLDHWNRHGQMPPSPASAPSPWPIQRSDSVAPPGDVLKTGIGFELALWFDNGAGLIVSKLPAPWKANWMGETETSCTERWPEKKIVGYTGESTFYCLLITCCIYRWFIYSFMGIGILLCLVTCVGHIAAEAASGCCLCFYTLLMTIMIIIEAALVSDMVFNDDWDKDLPYDLTGELERLRSFIANNIDICRWVGLAVLIIQALSLLLSMILRAIVTTKRLNCDSDDEYGVVSDGNRQPLLNSQGSQNPSLISMENNGSNNNRWSTRMREKYGLTMGSLQV